MPRCRAKGDIAYFKPITPKSKLVAWYSKFDGQPMAIFPAGRPIAYSTRATLDWLQIVKGQSSSWEEMADKLSGKTGEYLRDQEALDVLTALVVAGHKFETYNF